MRSKERGGASLAPVDRVVLLLAVVAACGPAVEAETGTSGSTTRAESSGPTGSGATQAGSTLASSADTSTAGAPHCESATAECPVGCSPVATQRGTWDAPELMPAEELCVALGEPIGEGYRSAWWTELEGELRFITAYQDCGALAPTGAPIEWTECTHAPDAPAPCRALCAADDCPGDADLETLRACDVEVPCEPITFLECHEGNVDCLLERLRDRTPGRYELTFAYPNSWFDWVLVVEAGGHVRATSVQSYDSFCTTGIWSPAVTCMLAEPQVFDECLALTKGCADACFPGQSTLAGWLLDCTLEPASCG